MIAGARLVDDVPLVYRSTELIRLDNVSPIVDDIPMVWRLFTIEGVIVV